jgi:hypothetical protein
VAAVRAEENPVKLYCDGTCAADVPLRLLEGDRRNGNEATGKDG